MTGLKRWLLATASALLLVGATPALGEVYVVVHAEAPQSLLDRERLAQLYLGRARTFSDGTVALLIDRPDSPLRAKFFETLGGMSLPQVNAYWARLNFTGRVLPPQVRESDEEVLAVVRSQRNAVGYLATAPDDRSVRVLMRLE